MDWSFLFFFNSVLLGVALAMDAFSVSVGNALVESGMRRGRMCAIAAVYALFQFAMPLAGWWCVREIAQAFEKFRVCIPWIALLLLLYIGGKMISDAARGGENGNADAARLTFAVLMLQGIATSIDALSVGFTISEYGFLQAVVCSLIIAVVTFAICMAGLALGRSLGPRLAGKAGYVGGSILIFIGIEIFVKGVFLG